MQLLLWCQVFWGRCHVFQTHPFGVLMLPRPHMGSLTVQIIPGKVVSHTAHKASLFLPLVVVHSLGHLLTQPLFLVELRWSRVSNLWIRWKQLLLFQSSNSSNRHGIPPEPIPVGLRGPLSSFLGVWGLPHLQLLGQCIKHVKTGVCLFTLREVHHRKADGITQARQQAVVKPIPQVLPLIENPLRISTVYHCHGLVDPQHVLFYGLTILLSDLIPRPYHSVIVTHVAKRAVHVSQQLLH